MPLSSEMSVERIREFHRVCGQIIAPEKSYNGLSGHEIAQASREYLRANSRLFQMILENPGDWRNTEFMYDAVPELADDTHMLATGAARGIYARLPAVCRILSERAYAALGHHAPLKVLNLGSGPARDTIWLCRRFPDQVIVTCAETCGHAIRIGRQMAEAAGLRGVHRFVQDNMLTLSCRQEFDILLLVGVLCPLDEKEAAVLLRRIRRYARPDGRLLATNVTPAMLEGDPFGDFMIRNLADWRLHYKSGDDLRRILRKSGWRQEELSLDGTGYHWILTASPR